MRSHRLSLGMNLAAHMGRIGPFLAAEPDSLGVVVQKVPRYGEVGPPSRMIGWLVPCTVLLAIMPPTPRVSSMLCRGQTVKLFPMIALSFRR